MKWCNTFKLEFVFAMSLHYQQKVTLLALTSSWDKNAFIKKFQNEKAFFECWKICQITVIRAKIESFVLFLEFPLLWSDSDRKMSQIKWKRCHCMTMVNSVWPDYAKLKKPLAIFGRFILYFGKFSTNSGKLQILLCTF